MGWAILAHPPNKQLPSSDLLQNLREKYIFHHKDDKKQIADTLITATNS